MVKNVILVYLPCIHIHIYIVKSGYFNIKIQTDTPISFLCKDLINVKDESSFVFNTLFLALIYLFVVVAVYLFASHFVGVFLNYIFIVQ